MPIDFFSSFFSMNDWAFWLPVREEKTVEAISMFWDCSEMCRLAIVDFPTPDLPMIREDWLWDSSIRRMWLYDIVVEVGIKRFTKLVSLDMLRGGIRSFHVM